MKTLSDEVYELIVTKSFINAFWRELSHRRATNPKVTQEDVFYYLDGLYYAEFKVHRFASFEAFRKIRDRKPH